MPEKQVITFLTITAQYVAEVQAGQGPRLSDYLARYPHYAAEIADFVAYYHTCEEPMLYLTSTHNASQPIISSLLITASTRQFTPARLAARLDLSLDLLSLLEQRAIAPATIPRTLYLKLASLLQLPEGVIQAYFFSSQKCASDISHDVGHRQKVAETPGRYSPTIVDERLAFDVALVASTELSAPQKARWQTILAAEQEIAL